MLRVVRTVPSKLLTNPPRIPIRLNALIGSIILEVNLSPSEHACFKLEESRGLDIQVLKPNEARIRNRYPKKHNQVFGIPLNDLLA